jgi:hypothetical protein
LVAHNADPSELLALLQRRASRDRDIVLFEVGSPVLYGKTKREQYHKIRWTIYTTAIASWYRHALFGWQFLVSPSSEWTLGHPDKARWAMAGATGRNEHIRDCEAMIAFYRRHPEKWASLDAYLKNL